MGFTRKKTDEVPAKGGKGERAPALRDLLPQVEWPEECKYVTVRLYPGVVPVGFHDYPLFRKDGSKVMSKHGKDKQSTVPKMCLAFDPETMERSDDKEDVCPYCAAEIYFKIEYWLEGVIRDLVDEEPKRHKPSAAEAKSGFKDKDNNGSWTPVRCVRQTSNTYKRLASLKQLNKVGKEKVPTAVDDEENGCDLNLNFNPDGTGDGMYGLQKGDQVALTDEEKEYLRWDIEGAVKACTESKDEAQRNVDWYNKHSGANKSKDGNDEDEGYEEGDYVTLTDDVDDTYTGEIIEVDDKKFRVATEEHGPKTFKWTDVTKMEKVEKPRASKGKGKKDTKPSFEEGDQVQIVDADDEDEVLAEGEIVSLDDTSVKIEVDGKKKTFKLADVVLKAPEKKAKKEPESKAKAKGPKLPSEGDTVKVLDSDKDEVFEGEVTEIDDTDVTVKSGKKSKTFSADDYTFVVETADDNDDEDEKPDFSKGDRVVVTEKNGDTTEGEITVLNDTKIVIKDDDDSSQTFQLAKVKVAAAEGKKKSTPARKQSGRNLSFD